MNNFPLLVCLLILCLHLGHCLVCISCSNQTGNTCAGPSVTCAANQDVCLLTVYRGSNGTSTSRDCGMSPTCSFFYSYMKGSDRIDVTFRCCSEDNCPLAVPGFPAPPNQFYCPLSSSHTNGSEEVLQCKGPQAKCFNLTSADPSGNISSMNGCANDFFCSQSIANLTQLTCYNATASPTSPPTTTTRPIRTTSAASPTKWSSTLYSKGLLLLLGLFCMHT
ncbi:uncharacterized protein [Dendropsophus ebraccatus]|uniref:uncharacterized protein n=1 Tax=Dendropsophus ebraccatus TaxID=150705 RepID=UPI003831A6DD